MALVIVIYELKRTLVQFLPEGIHFSKKCDMKIQLDKYRIKHTSQINDLDELLLNTPQTLYDMQLIHCHVSKE